jgi:nucleoside-diphosphate-sugar epimerase
MPSCYLITGATGFVGSHAAEACKRRGLTVRTIARPQSDTRFLEHLGVELMQGDLSDPAAVRRAVLGADVIVHAAAKVGEWGPVEEYRAVNVAGLQNLLEACKGQPLERFVHVSTLGVYAARHHHGTDETEPLPEQQRDGYTQSKIEAERLALRFERDFGVPVVVLRPGFVYGPRDRAVMPRLIKALRMGVFRYVGSGDRAMNTIFVGNLVDAIFRAIQSPSAVGQVYNLGDGEFVSKRRFMEAIADGMELPRPRRTVPFWLARTLTWFMERRARRKGATQAPQLTQARLKLLGLNLDFSIEKARRELGYQPPVPFDEAMHETMAWYRQNT